jgi:hypothetical protein
MHYVLLVATLQNDRRPARQMFQAEEKAELRLKGENRANPEALRPHTSIEPC